MISSEESAWQSPLRLMLTVSKDCEPFTVLREGKVASFDLTLKKGDGARLIPETFTVVLFPLRMDEWVPAPWPSKVSSTFRGSSQGAEDFTRVKFCISMVSTWVDLPTMKPFCVSSKIKLRKAAGSL